MIGDELRQRSKRFALDVVRFCLTLGSDDLGRLIRPQLLRAGTGVATNHRAACRGRSEKEFASRLAVVIEEADESQFWFEVAIELAYGPKEAAQRLCKEAEELTAIFVASRRTVLAKIKRRRLQRQGGNRTS
jgi:four helix bundle protein